jgi:hypothetical protein
MKPINLDALAWVADHPGHTTAELARDLPFTKSTTATYLCTLRARDLVYPPRVLRVVDRTVSAALVEPDDMRLWKWLRDKPPKSEIAIRARFKWGATRASKACRSLIAAGLLARSPGYVVTKRGAELLAGAK